MADMNIEVCNYGVMVRPWSQGFEGKEIHMRKYTTNNLNPMIGNVRVVALL
jgi:hypothetical protein